LSKAENFAEIFNNIEEVINTSIPEAEHNNALRFLDVNSQCFQNEEIKITPFTIYSNGEAITNFIVTPKPLPGKILNDKLKDLGIKGAAIS
jgi:hypothetical protein